MKIGLAVTSMVLLSPLAIVVCAQSPAQAPPFGPTHVGGDERPDAPTKEDFKRIPYPRRQIGPAREDRVLKKGLLAPAAEDVNANSDFLRQPQTGLIKLLPREIFDPQVNQSIKQVKVRGGGAFYSFFYLSHDNIYGADIVLNYGLVSVAFDEPNYGMLSELGDLPLDSLSVEDPRLAFINTYKPGRSPGAARCEIKQFREGVANNGSIYKLSFPVKSNATYLLRSIKYLRSDLLVAFRVTRQDPDGSVIIAWKLLQQYWRPTFEKVLYVNPIDKCPTK